MKVIKWIAYNSGNEENALGGMGGWFNGHMIHKKDENIKNHTWKDYISNLPEEAIPYAEALKKDIIEKNIRIKADEHQYSSHGVPLFEDNTISEFSYRAWGDLMAAIYSTEEEPLTYMEYYM